MRFSCCMDTFFPDMEKTEAIRTAKELGILSLEFWHIPENAESFLDRIDLRNCFVNSFIANRGTSPLDESPEDFIQQVKRSLGYADRLGCKNLIVFLDHPDYPFKKGLSNADIARMGGVLKTAAMAAAEHQVTLLLEPLNVGYDHPDTTLGSTDLAVEILKATDCSNLKILYDIYHRQLSGGDILHDLLEKLPYVGYLHVAGVPERSEPYLGEVNYPTILHQAAAAGFDGIVGLEFYCKMDSPKTAWENTLAWLCGDCRSCLK